MKLKGIFDIGKDNLTVCQTKRDLMSEQITLQFVKLRRIFDIRTDNLTVCQTKRDLMSEQTTLQFVKIKGTFDVRHGNITVSQTKRRLADIQHTQQDHLLCRVKLLECVLVMYPQCANITSQDVQVPLAKMGKYR